MKQKQGLDNIYTPSLPKRFVVLTIGFLIVGICVFMVRDMVYSGTLNFKSLFFLPFGVLWVWYALIFTTQTRVIVSEDGIELQRGGSHLFSTWDNTSHFGVKAYNRSREIGLFLHQNVQPDVTGLSEKLFYGGETDFIPIGQVVKLATLWVFYSNKINLEKLAQTKFGQDVAYYAPHLLGEYGEYEKSKVDNLLNHDSDS